MAGFLETIARHGPVLTEGAVVERIRRGGEAPLHPLVVHAGLVVEPRGRAQLGRLYRSYLDIGRRHGRPMLLLTPTWRATPERMRAAGVPEDVDLNGEAVRLLDALRAAQPGGYGARVFVGGLVGCRGDAYRPEEGLSETEAEAFHVAQVSLLEAADPDFLLATTLPALPEAVGLARVLAATRLPYLVSFIVRGTGTLLDGTPLDDAIAAVDRRAGRPPLAYLVNCVHPATLAEALRSPHAAGPARDRLAGLQGNSSRLPPEELDGRVALDETGPEAFADAMLDLHDTWGLRVLGGCCGTDDRYIEALARRLR